MAHKASTVRPRTPACESVRHFIGPPSLTCLLAAMFVHNIFKTVVSFKQRHHLIMSAADSIQRLPQSGDSSTLQVEQLPVGLAESSLYRAQPFLPCHGYQPPGSSPRSPRLRSSWIHRATAGPSD